MATMRLTEFHQLVVDEFGSARGPWLLHSHVLAALGDTPDRLIEHGVEPRAVWWALCEDFSIPESRRLGLDNPK
ncbi:DUF3046 domain-containing protein [Corynebacterium ulcerans]|nr:Hypothetical protein Cul05146_1395 [Corynebacterium ulcerans]